MGFPVILTPQALDDLSRVVRYIARDNPARARSFGNELIDRALAIGGFPESGPSVREVNDPAVREVIHHSYRIIYEVFREPNVIYVLRFWHAARGVLQIDRNA